MRDMNWYSWEYRCSTLGYLWIKKSTQSMMCFYSQKKTWVLCYGCRSESKTGSCNSNVRLIRLPTGSYLQSKNHWIQFGPQQLWVRKPLKCWIHLTTCRDSHRQLAGQSQTLSNHRVALIMRRWFYRLVTQTVTTFKFKGKLRLIEDPLDWLKRIRLNFLQK